MAAQKLTREGCKKLDAIGEDFIFERVMAGRTIKSIQKEVEIGNRVFYTWLHGGPKATRDASPMGAVQRGEAHRCRHVSGGMLRHCG
jgi:hypothetical protein